MQYTGTDMNTKTKRPPAISKRKLPDIEIKIIIIMKNSQVVKCAKNVVNSIIIRICNIFIIISFKVLSHLYLTEISFSFIKTTKSHYIYLY